MNFYEKRELLENNLLETQKNEGNKFDYFVAPWIRENQETGEETTILTVEESRELLKYLQAKGVLKLTSGTAGFVEVEMLPKIKPIINLRTLETISRDLKDHYTGADICIFLKEVGVKSELIIYPESKWAIFFKVFKELSLSTNEEDKKLLFKILAESIHPLNFAGNTLVSHELQQKFNNLLDYDSLELYYEEEEKKYQVYSKRALTPEEEAEILGEDLFIQEQEELNVMRLPENKEKISTLRKAYQTLMNITEVFCENPHRPTHELNDAYTKTKKLVVDTVMDLHLYVSSVNGKQRLHRLNNYCIPFNNLFGAEKEYATDTSGIEFSDRKLTWDWIRPRMNATYGEIDELYRKVEGSEILSKPDVQQTLNDASLLLSKTREENEKLKKAKQKENSKPAPVARVHKIEITNSELVFRNAEETAITKGKKRVYPPHFKSTPWEKITIQFVDEQNVVIEADKKQVIASYQSLGFEDGKKKKPDTAWKMLLGLARNNGETDELPSPIPETIRQQKSKLSSRLKAIFKNDSEPFYDTEDTQTYRIKIKLVPPQAEEVGKNYDPSELLIP